MENNLDITEQYQVFELNRVLGNKQHLALEKVGFNGFVSNNFDTEQDAINALVKDDKTYEDYVILKVVFIRK